MPRALHGRFGGPDAWLKALPDHQLGLVECAEVVAVEMTVALDDASTTSGVLEVCGPSECGGCGMQAGQDHLPAGAQHPVPLENRIRVVTCGLRDITRHASIR